MRWGHWAFIVITGVLVGTWVLVKGGGVQYAVQVTIGWMFMKYVFVSELDPDD